MKTDTLPRNRIVEWILIVIGNIVPVIVVGGY